jgi:hypothetical protein
MSEEEEAPNCCITISVPTVSTSGGSPISVLAGITSTTTTKTLAVKDGTEQQTVTVSVPSFSLQTGPTQTYPFSADIDFDVVTDVTTEKAEAIVSLDKSTEVLNIPDVKSTTLSYAKTNGTQNQTTTFTTQEYTLGAASTTTVPFSADLDLDLLTDVTSTTTSVLTGIQSDCSTSTLSYAKKLTTTTQQDVKVTIPTYTTTTATQQVTGTIDDINIPACTVPILKETGNYSSVPNFTLGTSSVDLNLPSSTGSETLYSYDLGGFEPLTITDADITIPECKFSVPSYTHDESRTLSYDGYKISTSIQKVELDINIPSCDTYSYTSEGATEYVQSYYLTPKKRIIKCSFNSYDLETTKKTIPFTTDLNIPVYKNKLKTGRLNYTHATFKKTIIEDCEIPVISNVDKTAPISGDLNINLGKIDANIKIPKIKCSTIKLPKPPTTETFYFDCATYSTSMSSYISTVTITANNHIAGLTPNITTYEKTCYASSFSLSSASSCVSFSIPSQSSSYSSFSYRSYKPPYYSKSSEKPRTVTKCKPGLLQKQPPSPTWTNTGRAKLLIEVTYTKDAPWFLDHYDGVLDGHHIEGKEQEYLCIYVRDYKTGNILERMDNSIDLWAFMTAKDAENTFNDLFKPYGNKVKDDPRYGQNPVQLIKANMTIERHGGIEDLRFIDTKLNTGHLQSNEVKKDLPYHKTGY